MKKQMQRQGLAALGGGSQATESWSDHLPRETRERRESGGLRAKITLSRRPTTRTIAT